MLTESSLQRIWSKTQEFDCVMISAFRGKLKHQENKARSAKLLQQLVALGYSVTKVKGGYIEIDDNNNQKEVTEESYFVANQENDSKFIEKMKKFGIKYDQDQILIIPKGGKQAYLFGTNETGFPGKNKKEIVGSASYGAITQEYFSKVGGRAFKFKMLKESVNYDFMTAGDLKGRWAQQLIKERALADLEDIVLDKEE